jgi:hypothetical protein
MVDGHGMLYWGVSNTSYIWSGDGTVSTQGEEPSVCNTVPTPLRSMSFVEIFKHKFLSNLYSTDFSFWWNVKRSKFHRYRYFGIMFYSACLMLDEEHMPPTIWRQGESTLNSHRCTRQRALFNRKRDILPYRHIVNKQTSINSACFQIWSPSNPVHK